MPQTTTGDGRGEPSVGVQDNDAHPAASGGRVRRAAARLDGTKKSVIASRSKHRTVDLALSISENDIATAGSLMAGALAFRLFLWTLPAALTIVGILGFNPDSAGDEARNIGLGSLTASTIEHAAAQAQRSRWVLIVVGVVLLLKVSRTLAKTVIVATAFTWRVPNRRARRGFRPALVTLGVIVLSVVVDLFAGWLRKNTPGIGLLATLLIIIVSTALWWGVSRWLPHRPDIPWWGLLPGALLVGIGTQVLQLVTIYYLSPKISSASNLYGSLGTAATLLLWAYLIARLVLASAVLNVTVLRQARPASD